MAGHVGYSDPQQLPVGQRVPHPDVFLGTGGKQLSSATVKKQAPGRIRDAAIKYSVS